MFRFTLHTVSGFLIVILAACNVNAPEEARVITGVVIDIESTSLTEVESFTMKALDKTYEIYIDPTLQYDFPISHLSAHRAGADPVIVEVEEREGKLVATAISDA